MQLIQIQTLIDITDNSVTRYLPGKELQYAQKKNFTTLLQCLGLRSIIEYESPPSMDLIELPSKVFGSRHTGYHNLWTFTFSPDQEDVYSDGTNPLGLLIEDINSVPIQLKLHETINMDRAVFDMFGKSWRNTVVRLL